MSAARILDMACSKAGHTGIGGRVVGAFTAVDLAAQQLGAPSSLRLEARGILARELTAAAISHGFRSVGQGNVGEAWHNWAIAQGHVDPVVQALELASGVATLHQREAGGAGPLDR